MIEINFRCDGGDYLEVTLLGRSHPEANDFWDGNWVRAVVEIKAGGFCGSVGGDIRAEELVHFYDELTPLQESLRGAAQFVTMENWFTIRVTGDGRGHMEIQCMVKDQPGIGNTLNFTLASDQTFTRTSVKELVAVINALPVIGKP